MVASIVSGSVFGIESVLTCVEVDAVRGMPVFDIVGKVSKEVREAKERVRVALRNCNIMLPPVHITVNISPADLIKEGTFYDLPIAVGVLSALGHIPAEYTQGICMVGELGLSGELKPVRGILPIVKNAAENGIKRCIVPMENALEGAAVKGIEVIGAPDFTQVAEFLLNEAQSSLYPAPNSVLGELKEDLQEEDFSDVIGQESVKRAALIAAAGFHHMMISGQPGAGKTMIAKRMPGILPPLTQEECLEISNIYSVAGLLLKDGKLITKRPVMAPHHTVTTQAFLGGGAYPVPGVISLSHKGVLFLGGYFCKTAETPNLRALWRFSHLEFFKKSAKNKLHSTFFVLGLPLFGFSFAKRFMGDYTLMAKLYTIWQKEISNWRNYTRMAKGEKVYGI